MDSKRFNIYAGSVLGAVLVFLLLNFFSSLLYFGPEHAGEEHEVLAFAVPVEEAGEAEAPKEVDLAALAADADPAAGEKVFNKCKACHTVEPGEHGVGPSLHGVVGSDIASAEGFGYSDALTALEGEWTLEKLSAFLENPAGYAPGTRMTFNGLPDAEDRVNVIAYLNQQSDSPVELAPEQAAAAEPAAEQPAAETEPAQEPAAEGGEPTQDTAAATGESTGEAAKTNGGGAYAELLANASAENGQKVFRKCQACHTLDDGKHRVGPSLHGLIGSDIASAEGYSYSDALSSKEGQWTLENLDAWLENPNGFAPGNKMTFPGVKDAQDRIDVLVYIDQSDGERDLPE